MRRLTETEKLARKNAKAVNRDRTGRQRTAELQQQVQRGEKTAAQAFQERLSEPRGAKRGRPKAIRKELNP